ISAHDVERAQRPLLPRRARGTTKWWRGFAAAPALQAGPLRRFEQNMTKPDADVIIAGAGMAGATLALALAQAGLKPLLIDPVPFDNQVAPSFDGRASAIAFASFRQWRVLGLAEALEP